MKSTHLPSYITDYLYSEKIFVPETAQFKLDSLQLHQLNCFDYLHELAKVIEKYLIPAVIKK